MKAVILKDFGCIRNLQMEEIDIPEIKDSEVDFVLDTIGGDNFSRSLKIMKPTGTIVCLPSGVQEQAKQKAEKKGIKYCSFMIVESNGKDMQHIAHLLETGAIKPHISKTFTFDQIAEAHTQIESGHIVGKVVIKVV